MNSTPTAPTQHAADAATIATAAIVFAAGVLVSLKTGSGASLPVAAQLHGTLAEAAAIAVRNTAVCGALILAPHATLLRSRWARNTVDVLAAVVLLPATWVAAQVVTHPDGLALMPHAPIELTAVALAAAWWWVNHNHAPAAGRTRRRLLLVTGLLLCSAAVETFLVPHA